MAAADLAVTQDQNRQQNLTGKDEPSLSTQIIGAMIERGKKAQ